MKNLSLYTKQDLKGYVNQRPCETKLGERLVTITNLSEFDNNPASFVIFGIPEDIGVRANFGKPGTRSIWTDFLKAFLNIQANRFTHPKNCILLGHICCDDWLKKADNISDADPNFSAKLHEIITEIDAEVANLVKTIVASGKIPIIVGGGHNNAYGNLKGLSKAKKQPINVLNIDAHTDFRQPDFRHSGNGFSFAIKEGFLSNYSIFGLHKNYTSEAIFEQMDASEHIECQMFESILKHEDAKTAFKEALDFVKPEPFGLEVDCDSIANFPSSAQTPSGFSIEQIRQFIALTKKEKNLSYIHFCEAKPSENHNTAKALSYLVSDVFSS